MHKKRKMYICTHKFFRQNPCPAGRLVEKKQQKYSTLVNNVNIVYQNNPISHEKISQKPNRRTRRNKKAKKSVENKNSTLNFFSCNSSGVKNKLLSLGKIVNELEVGVFCLQETHSMKEGLIKFDNSAMYQIFEQVRENKSGGGLSIGALKTLNPVWVGDGGVDAEAMTVQIETKYLKIRITNAYGPQEYDDIAKKEKIWAFLDSEISQCQENGSACLIMTDANAWLGKSFIKNDPHSQNRNGRLFEEFLNRRSSFLLNNHDKCEGYIMRYQVA